MSLSIESAAASVLVIGNPSRGDDAIGPLATERLEELSLPDAFSFEPVVPAVDASASTHALSPAAVLEAFDRVSDETAPASYVLAVRGYEFGLEKPLSGTATENLEAALQRLNPRLSKESRKSR